MVLGGGEAVLANTVMVMMRNKSFGEDSFGRVRFIPGFVVVIVCCGHGVMSSTQDGTSLSRKVIAGPMEVEAPPF